MSFHEEDDFEQGENSQVYRKLVSELRKGDFVILKSNPCKILQIMILKTGKEGYIKAQIYGLDIFTHKKYNEIILTTEKIDCPFVTKLEFAVVDVQDDICSYIDEEGNVLEINLPGKDEQELVDRLIEGVESCDQAEDGKACYIVVWRVMGEEKIIDFSIKIDE